MTNMIERVARALVAANGYDLEKDADLLPETLPLYTPLAEAALHLKLK